MRGAHGAATLSPGKTASAIRGRIVKPDQANLNPELARAILKIDFDPRGPSAGGRALRQGPEGHADPRGAGGARGVCPGGSEAGGPPIEGPAVAQAGEAVLMTDDLARRVRRRARYRCEYCRLPQSALRFRHQVDHIIADQHEGGDDLEPRAASPMATPQGPEHLRPRPGDPGADPSLQPAARSVARALRLAGGGAHRLDGRRTDDDPGPGDQRPC